MKLCEYERSLLTRAANEGFVRLTANDVQDIATIIACDTTDSLGEDYREIFYRLESGEYYRVSDADLQLLALEILKQRG